MGTEDYSTDSLWQVLLDDIRHGKYKNADNLPPETDLANELGISRTQLRDGLSVLEQNGFITRRRGIGTVINRNVVNVKTRLDIEIEFLDMVRAIGCEPSMTLLSAKIETANPLAAEKLGAPSNTPLLTTTRIIAANGTPVIFCVDHIPSSIIVNYDYTMEELEPPVFYFLEKYCHTKVWMDLTEIKIVTANAFMSETLQISEGTPLFLLDEVAYNIDNKPVLYAQEYFVNGAFKHTVLRKKL
ncbi:MAG TPA: GntR family transcriptional regulator [Clostridia bacterium]|nr:GntR family transcriptional regulator [Clostridia bacterium]